MGQSYLCAVDLVMLVSSWLLPSNTIPRDMSDCRHMQIVVQKMPHKGKGRLKRL
jgi:hypothetical protein